MSRNSNEIIKFERICIVCNAWVSVCRVCLSNFNDIIRNEKCAREKNSPFSNHVSFAVVLIRASIALLVQEFPQNSVKNFKSLT